MTPPHSVPDRDDCQPFDQCIRADATLPMGDHLSSGKVRARKRNADGTRVGTSHANPLFDTLSCVVEFPDGMEKECTANIIAENMHAQCLSLIHI